MHYIMLHMQGEIYYNILVVYECLIIKLTKSELELSFEYKSKEENYKYKLQLTWSKQKVTRSWQKSDDFIEEPCIQGVTLYVL